MATDEKFWAAVDENMLSRILNAFVWWGKGKKRKRRKKIFYGFIFTIDFKFYPH